MRLIQVICNKVLSQMGFELYCRAEIRGIKLMKKTRNENQLTKTTLDPLFTKKKNK